MFMFRSRKTALVKQAWKSRLVDHPEQTEVVRQVKQLLRYLSVSQLELFVAALESRGGDPGQCVLVPHDLGLEQQGLELPPHRLVLWVWRWPDLAAHTAPLRRLPTCVHDHVYECANPYHWARLLDTTESPPPPYSRFNSDLLRPEVVMRDCMCGGDWGGVAAGGLKDDFSWWPDTAPSEDASLVESQETGGTNQYACTYSTLGTGSRPWCKVAYWEGRERVGRLYPVCTPSLNIMGDTPHGDGLSLASLAAHTHTSPSEQIKRTREKIGLGMVLYQEGDLVLVYNRADVPLFITSPTLDGGLRMHMRSHYIVHKLPPGHILNIFDYDKARRYQKLPPHPDLLHEGPIDHNAVRVSFAKGWGPNYHRQEITECPCWLEILMVPAR